MNFKNHRSSGFRLGGGINFARFTEKGLLQFQYMDGLLEGARPGNVYGQTLESISMATAFEFRQGLFIDIRKLGLMFHVQQSILLREPEVTHHPAYYIPGTGALTPIAFLGRGNNDEARKIIPAAYFYLFYKLY